jgi:hypothetical protein
LSEIGANLTKAALFGASLTKLCRVSSISLGVICLFIFFSSLIDEVPTQHGRDGFFPVVRIISCPPMADAVVAVTTVQQYFPSMFAMECDGEGDPATIEQFRFPLFDHFVLSSSGFGIRHQNTDDPCE